MFRYHADYSQAASQRPGGARIIAPLAFSSGDRLGVFEIVDRLGVGGMGEVYRARDTKLRREVAIKILPEAFAADADRVTRFEREAELLASLNHPNIAAIYGVEESCGVGAIVMELVDGETLEERLPVPLDEALAIARQLVEALEAAHDRGVVHRDLKPANIKITRDGRVKVLDFGLAKAMEAGAASASGGARAVSMSPTLSVHATYAGVILGTAAYMSPEQARGKPIDRRTDIWAFGCVLFEMLTGTHLFGGGETVSDTIASILKTDIDWSRLPSDTPPHVRRLLKRCLEKDQQRRLPHIGVARLELDESAAEPLPDAATASLAAISRPRWSRAWPAVVSAFAAGAMAAAAVWVLKPAPAARVVRFPILLGPGQSISGATRQSIAISPDGTQVAFLANQNLYVRALGDLESRLIPGAQVTSGNVLLNPVFSPDSRSIAFVSIVDRAIKRVAVSGGAAVTLCSLEGPSLPFGLSWDGDAVLFELGAQILRVSANGGKPEVVVPRKVDELVHGPQLLPDGQTILFTIADAAKGGTLADSWATGRVVAQSQKSGERTVLVEGGTEGRYLPTGHIAYALHGVLFAVPFDAARLRLTGAPVPLVEGVRTESSTVQYSVSASGTLAYIPGSVSDAARTDLALIDRKGAVTALKLPAGSYATPRLSPDGSRVAFGSGDGNEQAISIYDLAGTSAPRRLTFGSRNQFPVWSSDGQRVAFQSDREGDAAIFWQRADGAGPAERLTKAESGTAHVPESWSPDGKTLLFSIATGSDVSLWTWSMADKKALPFGDVHGKYRTNASFSPDGRWVAYTTEGIFVQPFPATGAKYQIAKGTSGAAPHYPAWSRDGSELFYIPSRQRLEVVKVTTRSAFAVALPEELQRGPLFEDGPTTVRTFDISSDGRLLAIVPSGQAGSIGSEAARIEVVLNWFTELQQRVPGAR